MPDFVPRPNALFEQWVRFQKTQRSTYASTLGLTPADVTRMDQEDDAMLAAADKATAAQAASKSATDERDTLRATYVSARRADIARAKTHPAYTEAIGKDLRWEAADDGKDPNTLKPVLTPTRTGAGWSFAWTKLGQDYLKLFRRPAGTADWGPFLAIDSRSPYIDTEAGLKGTYEYYGQLYDNNDQPVGQPSDLVVVQHG